MKINLPNINKILLPVKAHYLLYNAGTGAVVPFMSVFAKQLGFSSVTVGVVYTISPLATMVTKPAVGAFADRFKCKKFALLFGIFLTAVSQLVLNFSVSVPTQQKMMFYCNSTSLLMDTCVDNFTITDDCALESVTSQTGYSTIRCEMTCQMSTSSWYTICSAWNATQYCETNSETLYFSANVPINSAEKVEECILFQISSIVLDDTTLSPSCPSGETIQSVCDINCNSSAVNELVMKGTLEDYEIYGHYAFWVLLIMYVLIWVGQAICVCIGDAICFELLGDQPHKYGYQRLWGAVGWGSLTLACGYIIDYVSQGKGTKDYAPVFYLGAVILVLNFISSCTINYQQKYSSPSILRDIGVVIVNIRVFVFALLCTFMGMCTALVWNFLFWVMEDLAAAAEGCDSQSWIKTLQGLAQAIQCLGGELPFFFLSGWILKRIGHVNCLTLITFALGTRFTLYSVISNPWYFLPVEIFNGITFGLFYATMASYAAIIAPPGTEATVQGVVGAVFEGIGVSLGSLIAGILIEDYGGQMTFRIAGISAFIVCFVHAIVQYFIQRWYGDSKVEPKRK